MTKPEAFTDHVVGYITASDSSSFSTEALSHAKVALMDTIAVGLAGTKEPIVRHLLRHAENLGGTE